MGVPAGIGERTGVLAKRAYSEPRWGWLMGKPEGLSQQSEPIRAGLATRSHHNQYYALLVSAAAANYEFNMGLEQKCRFVVGVPRTCVSQD